MTIQQTIQKAIEGGYNWEANNNPMNTSDANIARTFLDPQFWQCLGKAMGWEGYNFYLDGRWAWTKDSSIKVQSKTPFVREVWLHQQHRFIDHLADGKDIESFFNPL